MNFEKGIEYERGLRNKKLKLERKQAMSIERILIIILLLILVIFAAKHFL